MKQKMPRRRLRNYLIIVFSTILVSLFMASQNDVVVDGLISYLIVDAMFLAVLLYMLESNRMRQKIGESSSNPYGRIAMCYFICSILVAVCNFLPEFTCPAAFFALFFGLVANAEISVSLSTLLCVTLCMAKAGTFHELAAYCILIFIGLQMEKTMCKKEYRVWGCIILASASLSIPELFYYFAYTQIRMQLFIWNGAFVGVALILYHWLSGMLYDKIKYEAVDSYEEIIRKDYPLVKDIKNYSSAEYVHAMKVSMLSLRCASEIGANEMLAAAGGFYYRLGVIEGEPYIENGIQLAEERCFPSDVIRILSEYNGEQRLPSSRESAIVHMADACLKKLEMLHSQNLSTSWNRDMVIYQTLNELSATGIYDESGLSMNQFLKVRELLVREDLGYDNNDGRRN